MKILVTERYIYKYIKELEGLGYDVIYKSESKAVVDKEIEDVDILIGYNPFETLDISKLKKLKYIQLTSIGIDQVPKDKVLKQNILMCNNKGGYSIPIAEYIVMYILNIYKNTKSVYENKINKIWQVDTSLEELTDKKVWGIYYSNRT